MTATVEKKKIYYWEKLSGQKTTEILKTSIVLVSKICLQISFCRAPTEAVVNFC